MRSVLRLFAAPAGGTLSLLPSLGFTLCVTHGGYSTSSPSTVGKMAAARFSQPVPSLSVASSHDQSHPLSRVALLKVGWKRNPCAIMQTTIVVCYNCAGGSL